MKKTCLFIFLVLLISNMALSQDYNVGELTLSLTDSSRNRPVKAEIWYPTKENDNEHKKITELPFVLEPTIRNAIPCNQKFPLVLLSHGTGGNRFGLAWLAIALVKKGYIVAAPDHYGNTFDNKIPEYFVRFWERPLDISFLLDHLVKNSQFSALIDTSKVGITGFSFGGYTSLALAGLEINCKLLKENSKTNEGKKEFNIPELKNVGKMIEKLYCDSISKKQLKDNRIKAFVALAPALGLGVDSKVQTVNISNPVLIIGSENDQIAPVLFNAKKYNSLISSSKYIELPGKTGHYVFLCEADAALRKEAKKYYQDDKSVNRQSIHKKVEDIVIDFFEKELKK